MSHQHMFWDCLWKCPWESLQSTDTNWWVFFYINEYWFKHFWGEIQREAWLQVFLCHSRTVFFFSDTFLRFQEYLKFLFNEDFFFVCLILRRLFNIYISTLHDAASSCTHPCLTSVYGFWLHYICTDYMWAPPCFCQQPHLNSQPFQTSSITVFAHTSCDCLRLKEVLKKKEYI